MNRQQLRYESAARILAAYYSTDDYVIELPETPLTWALGKADRLLALVEKDGPVVDEPRSEIVEECDPDSRTITVYPCPKCGNPERDEDAAFLVEMRQEALKRGWTGCDSLMTWLFESRPTDERTIRDSERKRILTALVDFMDDDGGSFRKFIAILGMDYTSAYDEGWMRFTNALADHESNILVAATDRAAMAEAECESLKEKLRQAESGLVSGPTWGQALIDARAAERERCIEAVVRNSNFQVADHDGANRRYVTRADLENILETKP